MRRVRTLLSLFILCSFLVLPVFGQDGLTIHFIDVKEGDSFLIQKEDANILIDSGCLLRGYKLLEYLEKANVKELSYIIITHPHPDHISGLFFLLPKIKFGKIFDNGQQINEIDAMQRWYSLIVRSHPNYRILKTGNRLVLEGIILDVFWPKSLEADNFNDNSLVIKLRYNDFSCLFMADATQKTERHLLRKKDRLKSNILKVGHHGYSDATSPHFLQAVSPQVAIISASIKNGKGEPSLSVLDLLSEKGIKIYRTDRDGNIVVSVDKEGRYSIDAEKQ